MREQTDFGRGVEWALAYRGRTAKDVSDATGIAQSTISRWVSGHTEPRLVDAVRVARELDIH